MSIFIVLFFALSILLVHQHDRSKQNRLLGLNSSFNFYNIVKSALVSINKESKASLKKNIRGKENPLHVFHSIKFILLMVISSFYLGYLFITYIMMALLLLKLIYNAYKAQEASKVRKYFPTSLDVMSSMIEAGCSIDEAVNHISKSFLVINKNLANIYATLGNELKLLSSREDALKRFGDNLGFQAAYETVETIVQAEKLGSSISGTLKRLAADQRKKTLANLQAQAARIPSLITVPLIVFILPSLFIIVAGPAMLDIYRNFIK